MYRAYFPKRVRLWPRTPQASTATIARVDISVTVAMVDIKFTISRAITMLTYTQKIIDKSDFRPYLCKRYW